MKKGTDQEFEALIRTQGYNAEEATRLRQRLRISDSQLLPWLEKTVKNRGETGHE
mgnify:CR=1 FL=1